MESMKKPSLVERSESDLLVKIADSKERGVVLAGRRLIYETELGQHGIDMSDRHGVHFVALFHGEVVGGIRLIGPTPLPLEVSQFLPFDQPAQGRTLQVGGFWLRRSFRKVSPLTLRLFGLLTSRMHRWAQLTYATGVFLRTHVRAVEGLYRAAGFRRLPELEFDHPLWGKVYCMYLPIPGYERANRLQPLSRIERKVPFKRTSEKL
jgi:hypothetical protein